MSEDFFKLDKEYLLNHHVDYGRVIKRYLSLLRRLEAFITMKKIVGNIVVDTEILKTAVVDYYVDIARIKEFHDIPKINTQKIYGYMAYWLLKRKPIQIKTPFPGSRYVNELFVTAYLISSMLVEKGIDSSQCAQNASFNRFQFLLYYHLRYRAITQQSLELMIEAFFCGYNFNS